ncbi:MAG TPA: regulatory protein RecX [Gemmatimonadales bacterium]|nr:regulatory protein RecX [Gemmatimonadales bacterium]
MGRRRSGVRPSISAITSDARRPGAVRVLVGGELYCTVDESAAAGLAPGQPLDAGLAERLGRAADEEAAYCSVLLALRRRAHARADLARRLVRRGHPPEAVDAALARAERHGFLDDAAFAVHFVQTRSQRGRGPARLVRDLLALGVARPLIDRAVAEEWSADTDRSAVPAALAARRSAQLGDLPRPVKRRRLLAFLARRGFTGSEAVDAVRRAL